MDDSLPSPGPKTAARAPRARYRPRRKTAWQRVPIAVKILVPLLVVVGGILGYEEWRAGHAIVTFVNASGPVPDLELTVFPDQFAFAAPSPAPPLGEVRVSGDEVVLGSDLVPGTAFVRYRGAGVGTGYARVEIGKPGQRIELGPATVASGRVGIASGVLTFGLRAVGFAGVAGARVLGFGGGPHGVLLCETDSSADGSFTLSGFDASRSGLGVRVLASGHAVAEAHWYPGVGDIVVPLVPTRTIEGRATLPADVDAAGLQVLARGLPGVAAPIAADGAFVLDHVPPSLQPSLLIYGLPAAYTQRACSAMPGDRDVGIEVVAAVTIRGWVYARATQLPLARAIVWHEHGPAGRVTVETSRDGAFVLPAVPPGDIRIAAQYNREDERGRAVVLTGERWLQVETGRDLENIIIRVD